MSGTGFDAEDPPIAKLTVESLGAELIRALPLNAIQSLSIHDNNGEPVWQSVDLLAADEEAAVIEAITVFEVEGSRSFVREKLDGDRGAAFFAACSPQGELVSVVMMIAGADAVAALDPAKLITGKIRSIMQRLSIILKSGAAPNRRGLRREAVVQPRPDPFAAASAAAANSAAATDKLPLKTEAVPEISLHVQQLMKLRSGGRTRRYEVYVRAKHSVLGDEMGEQLAKALTLRESAAAIDRSVVIALIAWLKAHPDVWNSDPASFSINLSLGSLLDPEFPRLVAKQLQSAGVAPDTIGFEIPEHAFLKHRDQVALFIVECEKMGCYVVLDDFTMQSDVVPFLASRAMRVIKIDPKLTVAAMKDRLSQAIVIAISQASKVLGLHCVAKRIDSTASRQWLSAVGIDFAQGYVLEDPKPIDQLASPPMPKPTPGRAPARL
jgi:EAL domain-containing protein (putative c-di-GMP-specific phosphodiesterase class I)